MEKKLLTTLAIVFIASVALFTGCNKSYQDGKFGGPGDQVSKSHQTPGGTTTSPVDLGTAASFAVLGGTTVTNAEASVITGDLGVSPGTAITGFDLVANTIVYGTSPVGTVTDGLGIVNGTIYAGGDVAAQAHADAQTAYDYLLAQAPTTFFPAIVYQLNGLTLTPGVYNFPISADLLAGGTLTLDFGGDPNALFIFQIVSTLVTNSNSKVIAINNGGATTCLGSNVFWAVGSSATINGDQFIGTVIAYTTITMTNDGNTSGATNVAGRMLALGGEVTMVNSIISTCGTSVGSTKPPKPCKDFVTGGGWIEGNSGGHHKNDKATFGVSGGIKNGKYWGQLSFNDHNGTSVKSTSVTAYTYINATTRRIDGLAKVNGHGSYVYTVVVTDNGEPGRDDHFILNVNIDGVRYHAEGDLIGGNIQLHKECGGSKDDEYHYDRNETDGNHNCDNDQGKNNDNHGKDNDHGKNNADHGRD